MPMVGGVLGVLAIGCGALVGCSFSAEGYAKPTVSKESLQNDVAERLTKAGEPPTSVTCNDDLVGEVGRTARCEVVLNPTNSFAPIVTVTSVQGITVHYEMAPALSKEQLEKAVTRLVNGAAGVQIDSVSCETGLEGKVGAIAHCGVAAGGVKLRRTVEVSDVDGLTMNFDVVPILTKAEVENSLLEELERQLGARPDSAQCADNLEGMPGNMVDCTVLTGPDSTSFTLTVTTVAGNKINYSYQPTA